MKLKPVMVHRNVSLPKAIADWADDLATRKGHGSDFSAYVADLIRRDKERHEELKMMAMGRKVGPSAGSLQAAYAQIVGVINGGRQGARRGRPKA
jgi:hypothetical protein